jgi:hypothetical protein
MRRTTLLAGFSAATLLTGMTFAHAGNPTGPKGEGTKDCGSGFAVAWSPTSVFPPNHKMVPGTLTYTAPDGDTTDQLQLAITSITSDEVLPDGEEMNGAGNTLIDATWGPAPAAGTDSVSEGFQIRAERSGRGDGRTYTISYTAKADPAYATGLGASNDCSGSVTVDVPHDMGGGNDAKQQ